MKKVSLLAASVAFALTGCGGSDGDSSGAAPGGVVITAIDGYLQHAEVWVDTDNDLLLDEAADTKLSELTNASGQYTLPNEHKDNAIFIKAVANQTIDSNRGLVASDFVIAATAGSTVINPMTNMVVEQLAGDDTLTQEDAEAAVVASVTDSGLTASEDLIFGDYIADSTEEAKALNAIGETLVDNADLPVEKQLELTDAVADEAQTIIEDPSQEIDDFSPIVDVPADPTQPITVTPNNRPVHDQEDDRLDTVNLEQGGTWTTISVKANFNDVDNGDTMTFVLKELTGTENGNLQINATSGEITTIDGTGILNGAGTFQYQIFAEDNHGALSYPLNLTVEVEAPNQAPTTDWDEYTRIQTEMAAWNIQQGVPFEQTIDVTNLFKDEDGNVVEYRAGQMSIDGLTVTPAIGSDPILTISGTPTTARDASEYFFLYAVDDLGAHSNHLEMLMPQVQEGTPVEPTKHPLEDKFLHFVEVGSNNTSFDKAWCDSIYLDSASKVMYWNNRDNDNLATCDTEMSEFEEGVSYQVVGDQIVSIENGMSMTLDIIQSGTDVDGERHLISFTDEEDGDQSVELYTYYTNAEYVEEMIYNPVNTSKDNADWADREAYIAMPPSEGSKEIVVTELHVNGIVQQFANGDSMYTSASLHAGEEACDILKDIYFDYGDIRIHGDNTAADTYFHHEPSYHRESVDSCYIDFHPVDTTAVIPAGLYTIEAQPERFDEGERILFSFYK